MLEALWRCSKVKVFGKVYLVISQEIVILCELCINHVISFASVLFTQSIRNLYHLFKNKVTFVDRLS
jgi:hypothetical protein